MNFYRRNLILINSFFFLLIVTGLTYTAYAWSAGKTGQTQVGCTCHASNPSSNTKVTLSSSSGIFTFDPNTTTTFTVSVENLGMKKAGMNVGVKSTETAGSNIGTLTAGTGTKIESGEVTHNGAQTLTNGKFDFTFDWKSPSDHGTYWIRGAANAVNDKGNNTGDEWNRFTTQKIIVAGVTVSAPNGGENWCVGTNQTITWKSDGIDNVKIEYSTNSGTNWNLITASTPASTGSFSWSIPTNYTPGSTNQIRISDASKDTRNDVSNNNFTVNGEVAITTQPVSVETCTGQSFEFSVVVSGNGNQYQWRKNGSNIGGATSSTYSRSKAVSGDAGDYDCVVTTTCGNPLTTTKASLSVSISPSIATQPSNKSGCEGEKITLEAGVEGEFSQLQWYKDGNAIPGANGKNYTINSLNSIDVGNYLLEVTSEKCGNEISSNVAKITLNTNPKFVAQPTPVNSCEGSEVNFTAQTEGTIKGFQWYKGDTKINGANTRDLKIASVKPEDAGNYKLELIGSCGTNLFSNIVTLSVNSTPVITSQPSGKEIFVDEKLTLSVVAENPGGNPNDINYQWNKGGKAISGANQPNFSIDKVTLTDAGKYSVTVTNKCDLSVISNEVEVKVLENKGGPAITSNVDFLDFNEVAIGEKKSEIFKDVITNSGDEAVIITAMHIIGEDPTSFKAIIASNNLPITLEPNENLDITIEFAPTKVGLNQAKLSFTSNSIKSVEIPLRGIGTDNGSIISSVTVLDFGNIEDLSGIIRKFELTNPTLKDITIVEIFTSSNEFVVDDLSNTTLNPSSSKEVVVTFTPTENREYNELLTIKTDDDKTIEIPLKASATKSSVIDDFSQKININSYPNPSNNSVSLVIDNKGIDNYSIKIVDLNGVTIKKLSGITIIGKTIINWDLKDESANKLASGVYFAIITIGNKFETIPIVIR
ncbi:choice-of-anchor D domain-containing protein [bacterium]|nr:MAG: choice-of-anchor D domain-containing protein [bacterium]